MKLPLLLSQFLYQTKKLDLPGIGSFTLDPSAVIPEVSDRNLQTPASGISFKNVDIKVPDDALVLFIKEHTGKMKSLAASDLDFFLTTGKQLLNIGKPFYLEGIGTLIKNNDRKLDFTPGEYVAVKLEEATPEKKKPAPSSFEEPPRDYEPKSNNVRQGVLLLGLIAGLIAIGWGGYYLYKRNTYVEPPAVENKVVVQQDSPAVQEHTAADSQQVSHNPGSPDNNMPPTNTTVKKDTIVHKAETVTPPPSSLLSATPPPAGSDYYKFVILETTRKGHALRRYNQLLGFQLKIKMDQKDSSYFKLYFSIPATIRDTTHIKDSLADVYAAHVSIEK